MNKQIINLVFELGGLDNAIKSINLAISEMSHSFDEDIGLHKFLSKKSNELSGLSVWMDRIIDDLVSEIDE